MLTIPPEVNRINQQLIDAFGIDTSTGQPLWRVVWSDDQYEKRMMPTTDEGFQLLHPELREVPKYKQWIEHKWVLEQLVVVPDENKEELAGLKLSYEPIFPFENDKGEALPASFEAAKFVIDLINATKGKGNLARYKEEVETPEAKRDRITKLADELFGGDGSISNEALAHGEGIAVPNNYNSTKES